MSKTVHHLIHIHELKHLGSIYYLGCGRKFKLNEKGLLNCSHIEVVTCKKCLELFKKKWSKNPKILK